MINLIEGRSGSGKTFLLQKKCGELAKNGDGKLIYLIPEQSSFECETAFLRLLGAKDARRVNVLSFTRMYYFLMRETGGSAGTPIDDSTRRIIMSYTLEECAGELKTYDKQAVTPQFAEMAVGAVKELKQCGITPDLLLENAGDAASSDLKNKLHDISHIYELFNANVRHSGVDPFDNDMRLEERIRETRFFDGYTVFVDDFTGFTAQQQKIIELIMKQCRDMYISLCRDPIENDELFFTINRTRDRLIASAQKAGIAVKTQEKLLKNLRTDNEALNFLEENIYRRSPVEDEGPDNEAVKNSITAAEARDVYDECEYIAARISDLALSGECRWRDIAVVFRKSEKYDGIIDEVFAKHGIPFFMSKPQAVESKPLMRLAVSALESALFPNDEKKLIDAVKTGLMGVSPYAAAQLENYVFVWDIRGRDFFSEFTSNPQGYTDRFTERDKQTLKLINTAREQIAEPFSKLRDTLSEEDTFEAKKISTALYDFLIDCKVDVLLRKRADEENEFSPEELRLWDALMDILGKMHDALGERRITLRRYIELFRLVIGGIDISDIPQTIDQVLIGTANSVRFSKPYAVFIIGAADGEFPHVPVADGVWTDTERKDLISLGLPLYDSVEDLFRQEKFFVYNAVSAPTDKLYITYPKGTLSGGESEPSSIFTELFRIFPELTLFHTSQQSMLDRLIGERSAFELYAESFSREGNTAFTKALEEYLSDSVEYGDRLASLGADIKNLSAHISDSSIVTRLFGRNKRLSASQIENFYKCPFKYFLGYGVRLTDRRKAELDSLVYGNLLHYIMEKVIKEYKKRNYEPFSDEELEKLLDDLLQQYLIEELGGADGKSERFKKIYSRTKKRIWRVLLNMFDELSRTAFRPVDAELEIGRSEDGLRDYVVETSTGAEVRINGKIDRVDIMDSGSEGYVRVIDYKTKGKEFVKEEVVYGLNLQMLIYLAAIVENGEERYGEKLLPAAVFYMKSDMGTIKVESDKADIASLEKKFEEKKKNDLSLDGIFVDNEIISSGLDKGSVKGKKNNSVSMDGLLALINCVKDKIRSMSDKLDRGEFEAVPTGAFTCDYCEFNDLCRHEKSDRRVVISKEDATAILKSYEETNEKGGEEDE